MCCWVWFCAKISEPLRSLGSGALKCAYSKTPRFSGLVAFVIPTCAAFTDRFVFPRRRRERSSSSGMIAKIKRLAPVGRHLNSNNQDPIFFSLSLWRKERQCAGGRKVYSQSGEASGRIRGFTFSGRDRIVVVGDMTF